MEIPPKAPPDVATEGDTIRDPPMEQNLGRWGFVPRIQHPSREGGHIHWGSNREGCVPFSYFQKGNIFCSQCPFYPSTLFSGCVNVANYNLGISWLANISAHNQEKLYHPEIWDLEVGETSYVSLLGEDECISKHTCDSCCILMKHVWNCECECKYLLYWELKSCEPQFQCVL